MDNATAHSLVEYINGHSTHIWAYTMTFGERTWVILQDTNAPHTASCEQPILDAQEYLARLKSCAAQTAETAELRNLIENWLKLRLNPGGAEKPILWPAAQAKQSEQAVSPVVAA